MNSKLTIEQIRSWGPCYDPTRYLPEGWSGTVVDIVSNLEIPFEDALWCVAREGLIDAGLLRRFAAWCAAEALFIEKQSDKRSWNAIEVAVKFSLGQATDEERRTAGDAAWDASDTSQAVADAAWAAAWNGADGTWAAAWNESDVARDAAGDAASDAAWAAAWAARRTKLLSMLKGESDFTLSDLLNNYPVERT